MMRRRRRRRGEEEEEDKNNINILDTHLSISVSSITRFYFCGPFYRSTSKCYYKRNIKIEIR